MTFDEAFGLFILHGQVERGYSAQTLDKFRECFRSRIIPKLGSLPVERVTYLDILEFRKWMTDANLSVARQYSILMVLKLLFRYCRERLKIPCIDPGEIRLPRRVDKKVEYLTEQEVAQLIRIVPTHTTTGLRLRALIEVLLSTGLRISEALSLNRDTIDPATGEAEVMGKGGKARGAFFSPECISWIARYLNSRMDSHPAIFATTGQPARRLGRNDMSKVFQRLRLRSGINKKLTPHILRHTFCTSLLHRGADITFIKELAGHSDIQTTARYYLGVDKQALKSVLRRCQIYGWRSGDQPGAVAPPGDAVTRAVGPGYSGHVWGASAPA
jgi:integrase/recombinase XerD